jgi:hypothetical protein
MTSAPGQVIDDAAIAGRAGFEGREPAFRRCLARLVDEGYLNGQDVSSNTSWGFHIRGLAAQGQRQLGEWPQVHPVTDVEGKRRIRAAIIHCLYDGTGGDVNSVAELHDIGDELGISRPEAEDAGQYLEDEGLIAFHAVHGMGGAIHLTHKGLVEVESGRLDPSRPTEHFPATQVITVQGSVTNSQIGQAGADVQQAAVYNGPVGPELEALVRAIREAVSPLEIDDAERGLIAESLRSLEAVANRDDIAAKRIAGDAMRSLRSIIEGMAATGGYAALLHVLPLLPH